MPEETIQSLKMLYCYAPEDRQRAEEIDLHLKDLKHQYHIISQFDGELFPGTERREKLLAQFPDTDLVLLLISAHFSKVEAFWDEISHESWAVQWSGWCRVIALLLEPVDWRNAPFASREVLPTDVRPSTEWRNQEPVALSKVFPRDARPLTEWQSREQAFQNIEQQMRVIIEKQWLARGDFLSEETGEWQKILAAYNEALRLNPSVKEAWYGKGNALSELERYEEALSAYDEALRLDPLFSWAWYCKGGAFAGLKRYEEALRAYDQALRLDPSYGEAWYWKGEVLKTLVQYPMTDRRNEENLTPLPKAPDMGDSNGTMPNMSSGFALGRKREARQAKRKARRLGYLW